MLVNKNKCLINRLLIIGTVVTSTNAIAGSREQAMRMYQRIAGAPPSQIILNEMITLIEAGNLEGAAVKATNDPGFYNATLKSMFIKLTNEDITSRAPLNDSAATMIGLVRDDEDFRKVLYDDIVYIAGSAANGVAAYNHKDNRMYSDLETRKLDLSKSDILTKSSQSLLGNNGGASLRADVTAGVLTTRGWSEAFMKAGTNRAALRYSFKNFLCNDLEELHDTSRPGERVKTDVDRAPSGDSRTFLTKCLGCHAGMDGLVGAFAFYDFIDNDGQNERIIYTPDLDIAGNNDRKFGVSIETADGDYQKDGAVPKMNRNPIFSAGYVVANDTWKNFWVAGQNEKLGWRTPASASSVVVNTDYWNGRGLKDFGKALSHSEAFSSCMAKRTYESVCYNKLDDATAKSNGQAFEQNGYKVKKLVSLSASQCAGE